MTMKELLFVTKDRTAGTGGRPSAPIVSGVSIRYRELWSVEESFWTVKHDLKVQPVFHWKPQRVKAHIALASMAFATSHSRSCCSRGCGSRRRGSRRTVVRKCSTARETRSERCFARPSKTTPDMERTCRILSFPLSEAPHRID